MVLKASSQGVLLYLKTLPNASKNAFVGIENEELKVKIKAPADKGKANEMLINWLSSMLNLSKSQLSLIKGETSRHKVLLIKYMTIEQIQGKLDNLLKDLV